MYLLCWILHQAYIAFLTDTESVGGCDSMLAPVKSKPEFKIPAPRPNRQVRLRHCIENTSDIFMACQIF